MNQLTRMMLILAALTAVAVPRTASADDTIKRPGDHPKYAVEIEPHGIWGWNHYYAAVDGFGLGGRFSIPVTDNGFIPTINNSVAITFGADWLHYDGGCYFGGPCYNDANFLFFPVALQWNFFVAHQWSVFGEPGLSIHHAFYNNNNNCPPGIRCGYPSDTGVDFVFYAGGRFHINEDLALVARFGLSTAASTFSFGVSFM